MLRRFVATLVGAVIVAGSLLTVAAAQDAKKDAAKDKKADTKAAKEIKGTVTKVDTDKMTFSIKTEDGKTLDFKVEDKTKFVGPRKGPSKLGIKDERFKVGAKVTVTPDATGKTAVQVQLPRRTTATGKAKKDADKEK